MYIYIYIHMYVIHAYIYIYIYIHICVYITTADQSNSTMPGFMLFSLCVVCVVITFRSFNSTKPSCKGNRSTQPLRRLLCNAPVVLCQTLIYSAPFRAVPRQVQVKLLLDTSLNNAEDDYPTHVWEQSLRLITSGQSTFVWTMIIQDNRVERLVNS